MLKQILDNKIKNTDIEELKEKLEYQSIKVVKKSINKFLDSKTIYEWLNSGFYDLTNNAESLLTILCNVFEVENDLLQRELNHSKSLNIEIERFKDSYLFVNTNFKRKNEPIFALALLENKRRISLYKDEKLLFKSVNEILNIISNEIIKHYIFNDGKLLIWGNIVNYQLHLFGRLYNFSKDGKLIAEADNLDVNFASLSI